MLIFRKSMIRIVKNRFKNIYLDTYFKNFLFEN